jgi:hypothetical protein
VILILRHRRHGDQRGGDEQSSFSAVHLHHSYPGCLSAPVTNAFVNDRV